jgi:hypothetical protein
MYKWKVYDVPGDGNCLFSALGKSLDISASNLRHIAVQWAKTPGQKMNGELVENWIEWNFGVSSQQYLNHISTEGIWGGANEMSFLSNALNIIICVYEKSSTHSSKAIKKYEFTPDTKNSNTRSVCVLYTGGNHYMQVILEKV